MVQQHIELDASLPPRRNFAQPGVIGNAGVHVTGEVSGNIGMLNAATNSTNLYRLMPLWKTLSRVLAPPTPVL